VDAFQAALLVAMEEREGLEARDGTEDDAIPLLEDLRLTIRGVAVRLAVLAEVEIRRGGA
jgi:hypothetical protein